MAFAARFGKGSVAIVRRRYRSWAYAGFGRPSPFGVRNRLGRAGRFGRPRRNAFTVFDLLPPNLALRRLENPRVDGSIPSLATISMFLNCLSVRVSPADYPGRLWAEIG